MISPLPVVAVMAVAVDHDRVALVRQGNGPAGGRWSLPVGAVGFGETLMEATTRVLRKETGLEGVCGALLDWSEDILPDRHRVVLAFAVAVISDDGPRAGDNVAEATWVELYEVATLNLADGLAEFLHDQGIIATFT